MDSRAWVTNWLEACDRENIMPWEFDFKQFFLSDRIDSDAHLEVWLKYKSEEINKQQDNFFTKQLKPQNDEISNLKDPDKIVAPIYDVLGWTRESKGKGDTINSFKTTFTQCIKWSANRDNVYDLIGINPKGKLDKQYDILIKKGCLDFELIKDNKSNIERFAKFTHTIGNFWVIDARANTARGMTANIRDYSDITLEIIYNFLSEFDDTGATIWQEYIDRYCLQPFVYQKSDDQYYAVADLWRGHLDGSAYPKSGKDFKQFYNNVNLIIEERGKWLTKLLCDRLQLTNLNFYREKLANKTQIRSFNQIKGIME